MKPIRVYTASFPREQGSAGYLLAALQQYEPGRFAALPEMRRTDKGKPYFPFEEGLHFSISHSGPHWAVALSPMPIGLDIQEERDCKAAAIAKRFFHPDEYEFLKAHDFAPFFAVWTAKESYVKFTGQGIGDDFSQFSVVQQGALAGWAGDAYYGHIPFPPGQWCCICTQNPDLLQQAQAIPLHGLGI